MPTITPIAAMASLALAPLFTDHMVLQRGQQNPIWGSNAPNKEVCITIDADGEQMSVIADTDANGHWRTMLPELPIGGPYTITVDGSGEEVLDDVLVGDVWLASGQSNMEFQVERAYNAKLEIATANNPRIRHFKVEQQTSPTPLDNVNGTWECASPDTVGSFTAIGYFFARDISERLDVPVGIINSTWGGTCVEAWTSLDVISQYVDPEVINPSPATLLKQQAAYEDYVKKASAWRIEHMPQDPGNFAFAKGWAKVDFNDSAWDTMKLPTYWQNKGIANNGVIWFRREVTIPAEWSGRDLSISLGAVDDYDTTYFNGVQVGETPRGTADSYQLARNYTIPASIVKSGKAVVTVRVFDDFGNGGFAGVPTSMFICPTDNDGTKLELAGDWHYAMEHDIGITPSSVFAGSPGMPGYTQPQNRPAFLYNGMIHALVPYGIRGALWYQGEQNESNPAPYGELIRAMIRDWRSQWAEGDFPFYYVQLAAFNSAYPWAVLREAQDAALMEPNTGRALAIDVGNAADIHPRNKQEVARRLALIALSQSYGIDEVEYSGPVFEKAEVEGSSIRVSFTHAVDLHTLSYAPTVTGFELAGADGVYHPATGSVEMNSVVVSSPEVPKPVYVRYAWADCPVVNLINGESLPAAPFRTDTF